MHERMMNQLYLERVRSSQLKISKRLGPYTIKCKIDKMVKKIMLTPDTLKSNKLFARNLS